MMVESGLSAGERSRGRRNYQLFQVCNVVSFTMLSGSVLTLYALKLGASSFFVGLISSIVYIAFLFMIVGRYLIEVIGTKRQFVLSWLFRNIVMVPMIFAPLAASRGSFVLTMTLILVPFLAFNLLKGIGLVSVNPTLGAIAEGKDRGAFLSRLQMTVQGILIATNLVIAVFLGPEADLNRYVILIIAGIGAGILSTVFISRLPEPPRSPSGSKRELFSDIAGGLRRRDFRRFILLAFTVALVTGMAAPFMVVYAKQVYGMADNLVVYFLVVGNVGAIAMGILARRLIDRLGAKPLYLVFLVVLSLSLIPIIVSPSLSNGGAYLFLALVFFIFNFGLVGGVSTGQSYFFAITDATELMNLGILFNIVGGIAGAIGSFVAGALIESLEVVSTLPRVPFQITYGVVLLLVVVSFPLLFRLENNGRYSVRSALEVFLSRKDMRAVALLHKLDTTQSVTEEIKVIDTLANLDSSVPVEDLLEKLSSPRFYVRSRALRALESLPKDERIVGAMIREVKNHTYTTAHVAARILGRTGATSGIPVLRRSIKSPDYLLQCEATLALARLGDRRSIDSIEENAIKSGNPLVQIYAAAALEILESVRSIPVLFRILKQPDPPPYLRDEIILSIASICGMSDWFYGLYSEFLERARHGVSALEEALRDCRVDKERRARVRRFLPKILGDRLSLAVDIAAWFDELADADLDGAFELAEAARDVELLKFDRVAFLLAGAAVYLGCNPPQVP